MYIRHILDRPEKTPVKEVIAIGLPLKKYVFLEFEIVLVAYIKTAYNAAGIIIDN